MKCDFVFCDEFPKCILPDEELYDGSNYPLIHFSVYTYQGICENHFIIPKEKTLRKLCGLNDDINNGLIKSPTYRKKKHLTKISYSLGEFHMVYYYPILNRYTYHSII